MDTSKKYIEMCEKAKEIQKEWKPSFNDFTCDKDDLFDYPDRIKSVNSCADDEYSGTTDSIHYDRAKDMSFWLPRQDQLQEMVYEKPSEQSKFPHIAKFSMFWWAFPNCIGVAGVVNGKEKVTLPYLDYFNSMEQLWLAFVMKEKYKKTWDGEKWIKRG